MTQTNTAVTVREALAFGNPKVKVAAIVRETMPLATASAPPSAFTANFGNPGPPAPGASPLVLPSGFSSWLPPST